MRFFLGGKGERVFFFFSFFPRVERRKGRNFLFSLLEHGGRTCVRAVGHVRISSAPPFFFSPPPLAPADRDVRSLSPPFLGANVDG